MANEKYTVYIGTEKFKPAEGYFALEEKGEQVLGSVREYLEVYFSSGHYSGETVYLSPYFDPGDQTGDSYWDGLTGCLFAGFSDTQQDLCVLVKYKNGDSEQGGSAQSTRDGDVAAYGLHSIDYVDYVKIYAWDYDFECISSEEWFDENATLILKLGVKELDGDYVWTLQYQYQ